MSENRIPESELVLNDDGSVYHLHLKAEHVASKVILVGDPGRVKQVAAFFDTIEFTTSNREFHTVTGYFNSKKFTVVSTGIGTDNIDIVINELDAAVNINLESRIPNPKRRQLSIVRIGTSGGLDPDLRAGSVVVSQYGLGLDGIVYFYNFENTDKELDISNKLKNHLNWNKNLATPYLVAADETLLELLAPGMARGITVTATGFYGPQGRRLRLGLDNPRMHDEFQTFEYQGLRITNFEMETSALYGLGRMLGHRCCTVCAVIANRVTKEYSKDYKIAVNQLIKTTLDRLVKLD